MKVYKPIVNVYIYCNCECIIRESAIDSEAYFHEICSFPRLVTVPDTHVLCRSVVPLDLDRVKRCRVQDLRTVLSKLKPEGSGDVT